MFPDPQFCYVLQNCGSRRSRVEAEPKVLPFFRSSFLRNAAAIACSRTAELSGQKWRNGKTVGTPRCSNPTVLPFGAPTEIPSRRNRCGPVVDAWNVCGATRSSDSVADDFRIWRHAPSDPGVRRRRGELRAGRALPRPILPARRLSPRGRPASSRYSDRARGLHPRADAQRAHSRAGPSSQRTCCSTTSLRR